MGVCLIGLLVSSEHHLDPSLGRRFAIGFVGVSLPHPDAVSCSTPSFLSRNSPQ